VDSKGAIRWILGGKRSTFRPAAANAKFEWPHDIQLRPHNVVTVFDNHCCQIEGPGKLGPPDGTARGLVLKLDLTNHTYSFVQSYSRNLDVGFQGNLQLQPNGNVVMGWGARPYFTEFSRTGQILLDAVFPGADLNYRAYLSNWVGTPFFPPSGAARKSHGKDVVYASWDGATQVVSWRVLAGSNAGHLATVVSSTTKTNFETSITLTKTYNAFKVQALDSKGHVLGTSKAFSVPKATTPSQNPPGFY
ncbi:MAG: hypothetical protein JOY57_18650, partial [Actinobacteria bacterium]|nr:hypothetical protein [Actinomycetota bacterium]